jgi:hypothetical protein
MAARSPGSVYGLRCEGADHAAACSSGRVAKRLLALAGTATATLILAACSSTPAKVVTTDHAHRPHHTSRPATSPTTTPTTSATPVTTQAGPARCHVTGLSATIGAYGVATGHVGATITFTNTSTSACTLDGYPGLGLIGATGQALATTVHRGTSYTVPAIAPRSVTLEPGQEASFLIGYNDATGFSGETCPSSTQVEITPPNAYGHLTIAAHIGAYGPCGAVTVSPVFPGTAPPTATSSSS